MAPLLPPEVAHHLGYYVYLYLDPRTDAVFYVGKGKGERVLAHLSEEGESRKLKLLAELRALELEPRIVGRGINLSRETGVGLVLAVP